VKKLFRKLYGTGIIFFYYLKYPIVIGLPILYYGLDYKHNKIMDILWLYSLFLIVKDTVEFAIKRKNRKD
jgi:hypothetical protein